MLFWCCCFYANDHKRGISDQELVRGAGGGGAPGGGVKKTLGGRAGVAARYEYEKALRSQLTETRAFLSSS